MSMKALPLQFLNLGAEMMYIIDQRLRSQAIADDRAHKVRNDILSIMLSNNFVQELFHPQQMYSKVALKTVFNKLAHASIMKLNASSMGKLFDLMLMSLKHQTLLCPHPRDLLFITLNHLDTMSVFATYADAFEKVQATRDLFLQKYSALPIVDWFNIRQDLLMFVQDLHIRVSIFLKNGIQNYLGQLVLPTNGPVPSGGEVPGTMRFFDPEGRLNLVTLFPSGGSYRSPPESPDSTELYADRSIKLGLNIYSDDGKTSDPAGWQEDIASHSYIGDKELSDEWETSALKGQQELNLLAQLIGAASVPTEKEQMRLSLCIGDERGNSDHSLFGAIACDQVITIDEKRRHRPPELGKILGELEFDLDDNQPQSSEQDQNDLLDLLDSI